MNPFEWFFSFSILGHYRLFEISRRNVLYSAVTTWLFNKFINRKPPLMFLLLKKFKSYNVLFSSFLINHNWVKSQKQQSRHRIRYFDFCMRSIAEHSVQNYRWYRSVHKYLKVSGSPRMVRYKKMLSQSLHYDKEYYENTTANGLRHRRRPLAELKSTAKL